MLFFNRFEIIFYLGVLFIIFSFIYLATIRFKNDDQIDIRKHAVLLIINIVLLIGFIYLWRVVYESLFASDLIKLLQNSAMQGL